MSVGQDPPAVPAQMKRRGFWLAAIAAAALIGGCGSTSPTPTAPPTITHWASGRHAATRPGVTRALTVRRLADLPAPVQFPAAAVVGSRLLLIGLDQATAPSAEIVAVSGTRTARIGTLPYAVHDAAGGTLRGIAYVIGGGEPSYSTILAVDPGGHAPVAGHPPAGASDVAAGVIGGTVDVVGGYTGTVPLDTIVAWSGSGTGRAVARLPHPVRYAAVAAIGGRLIIAGGTSGDQAKRQIYPFDPADGRVRELGLLPHPVTHAAAAVLGDRVYVIGGRGAVQGNPDTADPGPRPGERACSAGRPGADGPLRRGCVGCWRRDRGRRWPAVHRDAQPPPVRVDATRRGGVSRGFARTALSAVTALIAISACGGGANRTSSSTTRTARTSTVRTVSSILPQNPIWAPPDPHNVYAAAGAGDLSPVVRHDRPLVYVPNSESNTVDEIDPHGYRIVRHFAVGALPQHVVPSYDLRTLWVANDAGNSLTPIDPSTGIPGRPVPVEDPYNMYFTPDGRYAIVVAERLRRLDFRDAHTMKLHRSVSVPQCYGVNHADYTADGRYLMVSCEFGASMIVVDVPRERVVKSVPLRPEASPQDVKLSPDGRLFYVADLRYGGLWEISASSFRLIGFLKTGAGAHGLYPSRNDRFLYVSDRSEGAVSVASFATRRVVKTWIIPHGSPDMGNVSASGRVLWLSGRYDASVYVIDTRTGHLLARIPVGQGPHGLCVWPQPGRYSLGHTGIMR